MNKTNPGITKKRLLLFSASLLLSLLLTYLIATPAFTDSQVYVLFLMFFSISLWVTEAIPPFAVALFILAFLVFALGNRYFNSSPEKIDQYVNTFSSSIIWLLLGGFFLAKAMTKTRFDEKLLMMTLKMSGTKPVNIFIAIMFTAMVASMVMSNTAASSMLLAAILPVMNLNDRAGLQKGLLLAISVGTATGGMATIIGTPANVLSAGILEHKGIQIDFLQWMIYGLPVSVVLTAVACVVLARRYVKDKRPLDADLIKSPGQEGQNNSHIESRIVMVVLVITLLLWLTSPFHNVSVSAVSAIPIVVLTLTGIIKEEDVKSLPWDVLLLIAGSMSLGLALESTGILKMFAEQVGGLHTGTIPFLIIMAFASMILSNVMSNTATSAILLPLAFAALPGFEKEAAIIIALASSAAIFLPVSTPPNAIVYSTGLLKVRDFSLGGLVVGVLGPVLVVLWVWLIR